MGSGDGSGEDQDGSEDEESARQAAIAESRRKLAELEADRPIWEEQARKRAMWEKAEQEAQRAKAEERRRAEAQKVETERRAKAQREEREMRRREEALKREREEMARREWDKRQRQQRWSYGPWTVKRALERYKTLSEVFDGTKFSPNEPLTLEAVPWPVLQSPVSFSVEDVDWGAVEKFFDAVRHEMRPQDYASFVEKSHRRFHPDRWRSRGLLRSVVDDAERGCLEVGTYLVTMCSANMGIDILSISCEHCSTGTHTFVARYHWTVTGLTPIGHRSDTTGVFLHLFCTFNLSRFVYYRKGTDRCSFTLRPEYEYQG